MHEATKPSPLISVVIATFNRAGHLEKCLASLERQTFDRERFEVVVVNDGSSDATAEVISNFARSCRIRFRSATHENSGVSISRNAGLRLAQGEFVLFTDDDCRLPAWWISRYAEQIERITPDTVGVGGGLASIVEGGPCLAARFVRHLDEFNHVPILGAFRIYPVHVTKFTPDLVVPYLRTSNALFRKVELLRLAGFDPKFRRPGGEDPDLCFRLIASEGRFEFDPDLMIDHVCRASIKDYFRTLGNYVRGEFVCRKNKDSYVKRAVQRNYEHIPLQKVCSLALALAGYPFAVSAALMRRSCGCTDALLFPALVVGSKGYALFVALKCQFEEWRKG